MKGIGVGLNSKHKTVLTFAIWKYENEEVLYSEIFLMMQNFTEMPSDPSEEIFTVFIFAEQMCDTWTTALPNNCHTQKPNL